VIEARLAAMAVTVATVVRAVVRAVVMAVVMAAVMVVMAATAAETTTSDLLAETVNPTMTVDEEGETAVKMPSLGMKPVGVLRHQRSESLPPT
jgi:MFS superfamily sulfate permease-like transporter